MNIIQSFINPFHLGFLYVFPQLLGAKMIVELGTGLLNITNAALISASKQLGAEYYCFDSREDCLDTARLRFKADNVHFIFSDSVVAGKAWSHGPIDFLFTDTTKTREATFAELETSPLE